MGVAAFVATTTATRRLGMTVAKLKNVPAEPVCALALTVSPKTAAAQRPEGPGDGKCSHPMA